MSTKRKVILEYLKGNIRDEKALNDFLKHEELKENIGRLEKELGNKVESVKPTDVSFLEAEIKELSGKVKEDIEVELIIEE